MKKQPEEGAILDPELERTARRIVYRKLWSIQNAAMLLSCNRIYMYRVLIREDVLVFRNPSLHIYAKDLLELFEKKYKVDFPELVIQWRKQFGIDSR